MKTFEIKHKTTNTVLFTGDGETLRVAVITAIKSRANLSGANLSGADLSGAYLSGAYLSGADLSGADLSGANLYGANLYGANLSGANLYGANLYGANLYGADLSRANLYGANLYGAYLYGANLSGANLSGADLSGANLSGANLSGAELGQYGKLIKPNSIFQCGPIGSRQSYLVAYLTDKGIVIETGCFTGFIDDFALAVKTTHGDNHHAMEYGLAIDMIKGVFKLRGME